MPFIKVIDPEFATGRLTKIYARISGPDGQVDNVLQIHSLRPHSLEGHMALYKAVLHHPHNTLPLWFLETIGVQVSLLNKCSYCVQHHSAGLKRILWDEPGRFEAIAEELKRDEPGTVFSVAERAALAYVRKLTIRAVVAKGVGREARRLKVPEVEVNHWLARTTVLADTPINPATTGTV